jgi:hypothetical protein
MVEQRRSYTPEEKQYTRRFKDLEEVEKIFMKKRDQHKTDQLFS